MEKQEKMLIKKREMSNAMVEKAITTINKMLENEEQVVVCSLVKKTGLSRAFFYNNERVHNELLRAQELQEGKSFVTPQKVIIDKAMEREIYILKQKCEKLTEENERLKAEKTKLQKMADAKLLSTLKNL